MPKPRGRREKKDIKEPETTQAPENSQKDLQAPFYGLVTLEESSYFKEAESTLLVDAFSDPEDRAIYIQSVFNAAKGKELKLVTNQICLKLVERLILYATGPQTKDLFRAFQGQFAALARHKYGSHCVETLFARGAFHVGKELVGEEFSDQDGDVLYAPMDSVLLTAISEIVACSSELALNKYGLHVVRVALLILAGKELPAATKGASVLRSKKLKVARKMIEIKEAEEAGPFQTPSTFKSVLEELIKLLIEGLDSKKARELAIEPVALPVYQIVVRLEGLVDLLRPLFCLVFAPEGSERDEKESAFVEYLLSDAVGLHFFEAAVQHGAQKNINRLYLLYMKDRIGKLVRRKTTGLFVVQHLLFKLGKGEVKYMLDQFVPDIGEFVDINLDLAKAVLEASAKHKNYRREELVENILTRFQSDSDILEGILHLSLLTLGNTKDDWPTAEERWRALFLESVVKYDPRLLNLAVEAFMSLEKRRAIEMCKHGVFSHVVEALLVTEGVDAIVRRKMLNLFIGEIAGLSCNAYGLHIVDKLWNYTVKMTMYKERIAGELEKAKDIVKESMYGRNVWKNWKMDLFVRKRSDWRHAVKEQEREWEEKEKLVSEKTNKAKAQAEEAKNERKRPNVGINSGFTTKKTRR